DAMTFDDPFFSILRKGREFRTEKLAAVGERKRIPNPDHTAPRPFSDELAEPVGLKPVWEDIAIGRREFITQRNHRPEKRLRRIGLRRAVARDLDHDESAPQPVDY